MTVGQKLNSIWRFGRQSLKKPQILYARPTVDQTHLETLPEHFTSSYEFLTILFGFVLFMRGCLGLFLSLPISFLK